MPMVWAVNITKKVIVSRVEVPERGVMHILQEAGVDETDQWSLEVLSGKTKEWQESWTGRVVLNQRISSWIKSKPLRTQNASLGLVIIQVEIIAAVGQIGDGRIDEQ